VNIHRKKKEQGILQINRMCEDCRPDIAWNYNKQDRVKSGPRRCWEEGIKIPNP
jgi:hypothetical protein